MEIEQTINRLSKPKISLAMIDKVMDGRRSSDPLLVINSMHSPTCHVEVICMAAGRELPYFAKNYEESLYIIEGRGTVSQKEGDREQTYEFNSDDFIFIPAAVPAKLVNTGDRPLKFVSHYGVSLNPIVRRDVNPSWYDAFGYYRLSPLASKDIEVKRLRLIRSGEREPFIQGMVQGGVDAGLIKSDAPNLKSLERGVQYPNCGSRTIASCINIFRPGEKREMRPGWEHMDRILYVIEGKVTEYEGWGNNVEEMHGEEGDILYQPDRVVHLEISPEGGKWLVMWGVFTIPFFAEMLKAPYGGYGEQNMLLRAVKY